MWELCKIYGKLPDDDFFEDMDPVLKLYLFEHWLEDRREEVERDKNHGYLIGSFINPEAVQKMISTDNKHVSSDEEFEELSRKLIEQNRKELAENGISKRRHRRKILKE